MRCNALHRRRRRSRIRMTACKVKLTTSKSSSAAFPRTLSLKQQRWVDFTSKWTCGRNTHEHTHTHTQEHTQEHTHKNTHKNTHTRTHTHMRFHTDCAWWVSFLFFLFSFFFFLFSFFFFLFSFFFWLCFDVVQLYDLGKQELFLALMRLLQRCKLESNRITEMKERVRRRNNELIKTNDITRQYLELQQANQAQQAFQSSLMTSIAQNRTYKPAVKRQEKAILALENLLQLIQTKPVRARLCCLCFPRLHEHVALLLLSFPLSSPLLPPPHSSFLICHICTCGFVFLSFFFFFPHPHML